MPPGGANIAIFVAPTDVGHIPRYRRYGLRFFELKFPAATAVGCLGGRRARGTYVRALPSNFFDRKGASFFSLNPGAPATTYAAYAARGPTPR